MNQDFYTDLIAKHLSGNITPGEEQQLRVWLSEDVANRTLLKDMEAVWEISSSTPSSPVDVSAAWGRLEQSIVGSKPRLRLHRHPLLWLAAALLLLVVFAFLLRQFVVEPVAMPTLLVETAPSEKRILELSDGSVVTLNGSSRLEFVETDRERRVRLSGEAFFEVTRQVTRPFIIACGETRVRVLGTSFLVRAYADEPEQQLFVVEGAVSWGKADEVLAPMVLTAGMAGKYDKEQAILEEVKIREDNMLSWKSDTLVFSDTRMADVVHDLEQHFGIEIEVVHPAILNCHFYGTFVTPRVTDILDAIALAMDLKYEVQQNGVYRISGAGCPR
jgi:ferric-dicitrate binding protein FerR (iron transport regulator)